MTFMAFLLMIILFLLFFLFFSGINPQDVTIFYYGDQSVTYPLAIVLIGCVLTGLILGYGAHLYSTLTHLFKHWRHGRADKRNREVASIYREGVGCLLSGDIKKAHTLLQKALDRDPSRVETYIAMASVFQQEDAHDEGVNLLLKAKGLDARSLEVLFKLATIYEEISQDEKAVGTYLEILSIEKNNRKALRCLRELNIRHGRWQEALERQQQVMKVGPGRNRLEEEKSKLHSLRYEVARRSLEDGNVDVAKATFKELIKESADFVPSRVSLGDAYRQQDRPEDAVRVWRDGYKDLGKSIFLSRLEDLYLEAEDPSGLFDLYKGFIAEREDDLILRLFFGKLCLRLEMVDEAFEQLYALENAGIESPQLNLLLAEAHRRRNRIDEAIEQYKKALGVDVRLNLNYICEDCSAPSMDWQSRCEHCGTWGSFIVAGRKQLLKASDSRSLEATGPIHHGERK